MADKDKLAQQAASLKKELDDETILRVDLENRLQSAKEELAFKESVHQRVSFYFNVITSVNFSL